MELTEQLVETITGVNSERSRKIFERARISYKGAMATAYAQIKQEHSVALSEVASWLGSKLTDTNKRARKHGLDCNITHTYLVELYLEQNGRCALTGVIMQCESGTLYDKGMLNISIDRINNKQGYVVGNIRLLTHWANNAKSTYSDEEFYAMIRATSGSGLAAPERQRV
jgi:hypothetical protein